MWGDDSDILDLHGSPEMRRASEMLSQAGDALALDTLPLKNKEATCSTKCFEKVRDVWNMSSEEKLNVLGCVEKCEEPLEHIGELLDEERVRIIESTSECLEKCREDDESCANRCVSSSITQERVDSMIDRVRARILSYKYS